MLSLVRGTQSRAWRLVGSLLSGRKRSRSYFGDDVHETERQPSISDPENIMGSLLLVNIVRGFAITVVIKIDLDECLRILAKSG